VTLAQRRRCAMCSKPSAFAMRRKACNRPSAQAGGMARDEVHPVGRAHDVGAEPLQRLSEIG